MTSRRTVMTAFGKLLGARANVAALKGGADQPEGTTFGDYARAAKGHEAELDAIQTEYLNQITEEERYHDHRQ